jgi:hypothetical protein
MFGLIRVVHSRISNANSELESKVNFTLVMFGRGMHFRRHSCQIFSARVSGVWTDCPNNLNPNLAVIPHVVVVVSNDDEGKLMTSAPLYIYYSTSSNILSTQSHIISVKKFFPQPSTSCRGSTTMTNMRRHRSRRRGCSYDAVPTTSNKLEACMTRHFQFKVRHRISILRFVIKAGFRNVAENAYPTKHDQHEIHFGFQFGIRLLWTTLVSDSNDIGFLIRRRSWWR